MRLRTRCASVLWGIPIYLRFPGNQGIVSVRRTITSVSRGLPIFYNRDGSKAAKAEFDNNMRKLFASIPSPSASKPRRRGRTTAVREEQIKFEFD